MTPLFFSDILDESLTYLRVYPESILTLCHFFRTISERVLLIVIAVVLVVEAAADAFCRMCLGGCSVFLVCMRSIVCFKKKCCNCRHVYVSMSRRFAVWQS